jgi:hypothetical protein
VGASLESARSAWPPDLQGCPAQKPCRLDFESRREPDERLDAEVDLRHLHVLEPANVETGLFGERRLAETEPGPQTAHVRRNGLELLLRLAAPHASGGTAACWWLKRGALGVLV